jgi:hypothetical protein
MLKSESIVDDLFKVDKLRGILKKILLSNQDEIKAGLFSADAYNVLLFVQRVQNCGAGKRYLVSDRFSKVEAVFEDDPLGCEQGEHER